MKAVTIFAMCLASAVSAAAQTKLYTTTESAPWVESEIATSSSDGAVSLFSTDGKTARAGSVPWRAWGTTFNELDLDALRLLKTEEQEEILRNLFAPDGDMRFTRGRLTMNANDYSRAWYSCSEKEGDFDLKAFNIEHDKTNQIALVRMAQKYMPDMKFWVSPWSPPAWMKHNKDYPVMSSKSNNQPKEKDGLIYGGVRDEKSDPNEMWLQGKRRKPFPRRIATSDLFIMEEPYLKAYADMFVKFVELYRAEGVPIDMVMYQNEAYSYTPYPGCAWTKEGTVRFNRDYLAPALKAKAPGVKLYLGTFNTNRREYIKEIIEAPGILDCIDGLGFQWEGRDVMETLTDKYPGKHRICSESECGNGRMDWRAAEHTAWLIFRNMGFGADEWYNWNFILCDQGCSSWGWKQNALIRVRSANRTFEYRPEYYAVKHFAHFIKPGAVQLAYRPEGNHDGVEAVCYKNPDGSIVTVAANFSNDDKHVSFGIAGTSYSISLKPHSFNTIVEEPYAYLMVYHKDVDHGLHMAVSDDSYSWRALNGDKAVVDITDVALQKGIRDPFIARASDGTFIVAMTDLHIFAKREGLRDTDWERPKELYDWGNNRGLVILTSKDLISWEKHYINFTEIPGFENVGCVWAPELTWDDATGSFLMHFTTRFGNGRNQIYAAHLKANGFELAETPFELFSAPRDENGKLKYNVIDSDIVKDDNGLYHLFYVSHEGTACIHHATSQNLTGPYTELGIVPDGEKRGHEAPNCWRRPDGTWVLMWDAYSRKPHNFGFVETKDFKEWKPIGYFDQRDGKMTRTGFAEQKHGGAITIPASMAKNLEENYK